MYKIIGADGQPYGPATGDLLKRWLAENRVNGQTLTQREGTAEWQPLETFPEFAGLKSAPPPLADAPRQTLASRASTKIPAGICGILLGGLGIHKFILGYTGAGLIMLLVSVFTCFLATPVFHVIGLIEGILYLSKSDEEFVTLYVDGRKEWF
jgi:TM2 domain-containing membrane protein YozV